MPVAHNESSFTVTTQMSSLFWLNAMASMPRSRATTPCGYWGPGAFPAPAFRIWQPSGCPGREYGGARQFATTMARAKLVPSSVNEMTSGLRRVVLAITGLDSR